jgi:hypothetical protein
VALAACAGDEDLTALPSAATPDFDSTADPLMAQTLQAEVGATAAQIVTLPVMPTPTDAPLPTLDAALAEGTPLAENVGLCPVPSGFILHPRDGFCIAAPADWIPLNVDGGLAGSLRTTPGQTISLRPEWATDSTICHLLIYISDEPSVEEHLDGRHAEFAARTDLTEISLVQVRSLATMKAPGFTWVTQSGGEGGIFAGMLGPNRLVHISYGGSQCPADDIVPILETLRFE